MKTITLKQFVQDINIYTKNNLDQFTNTIEEDIIEDLYNTDKFKIDSRRIRLYYV